MEGGEEMVLKEHCGDGLEEQLSASKGALPALFPVLGSWLIFLLILLCSWEDGNRAVTVLSITGAWLTWGFYLGWSRGTKRK